MSCVVDLLERTLPLLLTGALMTLRVLLCSACLSLVLGVFFGVCSCERLKIPGISHVVEGVTFVLRAVPFFVQLLIFYFVVPDVLGLNLDVFPASIMALGVCSSGYVCQIIRGGLNAVPPSQWEAAFVLGYNGIQTLYHIIFPQVFRNVLPSLNNEVESMLKSTSILSSIGMLELTRMGMNIVSRELKQPLVIYLVVAVIYVCMSLVFNLFAKKLERKMRLARAL